MNVELGLRMYLKGRGATYYPLARERRVNLLVGLARIFVYYIRYINVSAGRANNKGSSPKGIGDQLSRRHSTLGKNPAPEKLRN